MKAASFIDELLAEQQELTAVERFAQRHNSRTASLSREYQDLIPLERPRPGEQYSFRVDLDLCTGCKACVSACHSLNGLDEDEMWRTTGLLHGGTTAQPYQQTVTTACHHCVEPACLEGCPVLAYEKDEATGIVRHLDDQCIGCQYCVLKCPYDVPKYSSKRGIVRKCDMCHSRLADGEPPACVQACPSGAISIRLVSKVEIARACADSGKRLLPGAFPSEYTQPTTSYVSRRPFPGNCEPADAVAPRLESPHWPLVWMLVLTQTASGIFLTAWLTAVLQPQAFAGTKLALSMSGFAGLLGGLFSSVLHLGRPLGAWRALLGLRRSWMSREILALILFALAALGAVGANWFGNVALSFAPIAAMLGLVSVFCSAMIYVDTRRPAWAPNVVFPKFFGAALLLGASGAAVIFATDGFWREVHAAAWASVAFQTGLLIWETQRVIGALGDPADSAHIWLLLAWRARQQTFLCRVVLSLISIVCAVAATVTVGSVCFCATIAALISAFASQVIGRYLFFVAAAAPKMPGSFLQ